MAISTVEKGNAFRDHVAGMLAAAGFRVETEVRRDFKKVDIVAVRQNLGEPETYLIETKNYNGNIVKEDANDFIANYGTLIENRAADRAWFISMSDISPDARALINAKRSCKAMTYKEFQRIILGVEPYLHDLVSSYQRDKIAEWYVRPRTESDGTDLEGTVRQWLAEPTTEPLAIVSGYGKGKSTFARHLTAVLADEALKDPTKRVPILVPLGSIVDEQSLEGLLGKIFTSFSQVQNYNFDLFQKLNDNGFFIVVFDGFDEMKHGMTLHRFESNIDELMRLNRGNAKVMILGRDTAFQTDVEFRSIIMGRKKTAGGYEVPVRSRPAFRQVGVREFELLEARQFVERFFPIVAREASTVNDREWIDTRTQELVSGKFDDLLVRPVHAQMLCYVASDPNLALSTLTKHGLFDRFVHFLIEREVQKRARDSRFTEDVRRRFNASVALWLWAEGGVSTVSLASLPASLCNTAAAGVHHDYDEDALRKELVAGCLVEKSGGTVFFGHRSLQEFLVAEAILHNSEIFGDKTDSVKLISILRLMTAEVTDFVIDTVLSRPELKSVVANWYNALGGVRRGEITRSEMKTLVDIATRVDVFVPEFNRSPWYIWLHYFIHNKEVSFQPLTSQAGEYLISVIGDKHDVVTLEEYDTVISAIALICYASQNQTANFARLAQYIFSSWLRPAQVAAYTEKALKINKNDHVYVKDTDDILFWAFLHGLSVDNPQEADRRLPKINFGDIIAKVQPILTVGFHRSFSVGDNSELGNDASDGAKTLPSMSIDPQSIYRRWGGFAKPSDLEKVRIFFNDPSTRRKIRPLEVEIAPSRASGSEMSRLDAKPFGKDQNPKRPTLHLPSHKGRRDN